jgi:hypothetical protein
VFCDQPTETVGFGGGGGGRKAKKFKKPQSQSNAGLRFMEKDETG